MDWSMAALLAGAGVLGGAINALAGGATLITFPAMVAAGLPPVIANASSAVAISRHILAALADRENLPAPDRRFWLLSVATTVGGALGAFVLLAIPPAYFILPVPALIAFATLLFAFAPQVQAWSARRGAQAQDAPRARRADRAGIGVWRFLRRRARRHPDRGDIDHRPRQPARHQVAEEPAGHLRHRGGHRHLHRAGIGPLARHPLHAGGRVAGRIPGRLPDPRAPAQAVRLFVIVTGAAMTIIYAARCWF